MPCTIYMTEEVLRSPAYLFTPLEGGKGETQTFRYVEPINGRWSPTLFFGGGAPAVWTDPPTKARLGGPHRRIYDIEVMWSLPLVSEAFRAVVESVESDMHQFFPVDCFWKNGEFAARRYFMNITVTLDAVDETRTTLDRNPYGGGWAFTKTADRLFYSPAKIGDHHLWVERDIFLIISGSDTMREAFERAKLHGVEITPVKAA
jgi:hypothetical protein